MQAVQLFHDRAGRLDDSCSVGRNTLKRPLNAPLALTAEGRFRATLADFTGSWEWGVPGASRNTSNHSDGSAVCRFADS